MLVAGADSAGADSAGADSAVGDAPAPLTAASVAVISSTGKASCESGVCGAEGMAATAGSLRWWNHEQPETVTSTSRPATPQDGIRTPQDGQFRSTDGSRAEG